MYVVQAQRVSEGGRVVNHSKQEGKNYWEQNIFPQAVRKRVLNATVCNTPIKRSRCHLWTTCWTVSCNLKDLFDDFEGGLVPLSPTPVFTPTTVR